MQTAGNFQHRLLIVERQSHYDSYLDDCRCYALAKNRLSVKQVVKISGPIIPLSICWIEMKGPIIMVAAVEEFTRGGITSSRSRPNWMANNAMADSISMKMIDRSFLPPPVAPKKFSDNVRLASKYTFMILNTIKPVTVAFTVKDRARHVHNTLVDDS